VIDAYDGSVTAYQVDSADPLVRTFAKIFPGIFQPLGSMPADLRAHLAIQRICSLAERAVRD